MGLDMYLEARRYVSQTDWKSVPQRRFDDPTPLDLSLYHTDEYRAVASIFPEGLIKHSEGGSTAGINIGYWRKANQIHGWFVKHIQDGVDNCGEYPVSRERLVELLDTVKQVLDGDKAMARELLPVTEGFFFGNYNEDDGYNEWYYEQLRDTETMLTDILEAVPEGQHLEYDFYYTSSW
jgi:hypothetical protein